MRIQKKAGRKPRGRCCEGMPTGTLAEMDEATTRSLSGQGKGKLAATYGKVRWNGAKK